MERKEIKSFIVMKELDQKYRRLQDILRGYGSVAVAFSSGVDSTFLLQAAHEALGERVLAITTTAPWFPQRESEETKAFCAARGIRHLVVSAIEPGDEDESDRRDDDGSDCEDNWGIPQFRENPPDRCYHCKKALFQNMKSIAARHGIAVIAEGSNTDDDGDYRPGHRAIRELGIRSPLREADLSKDDIRQLSRQMGLPTWDKPSFACLASRFPYGELITGEKLQMVEQAEEYLLVSGFTQMRVRIHETTSGDLIGRIELPEEDISRLLAADLRTRVREKLQALGFTYISLDLAGFQTGSMNRTLGDEVLRQGLAHGDTTKNAPEDMPENTPGEAGRGE